MHVTPKPRTPVAGLPPGHSLSGVYGGNTSHRSPRCLWRCKALGWWFARSVALIGRRRGLVCDVRCSYRRAIPVATLVRWLCDFVGPPSYGQPRRSPQGSALNLWARTPTRALRTSGPKRPVAQYRHWGGGGSACPSLGQGPHGGIKRPGASCGTLPGQGVGRLR
jgi:hypothetical protein